MLRGGDFWGLLLFQEGLVEPEALWLNPKWVEDLSISGEKKTGILRTSLNKSFEFREG